LDTFPYLEHIDNMVDSESQRCPSPLQPVETYRGVGAPLSDSIADPWEWEAQRFLVTNLQNNPYYRFAMREEYEYIQPGIKKDGIKMYYEKMLKEANTDLHFPTFINRDDIQQLVASI